MRGARLACLLLLGGCNSMPELYDRPLPFHVALAPMSSVEVALVGPEGELEFAPGEGWVERVNRALQRELGSEAFVAVSRLEALPVPGRPMLDETAWLEIARSTTDADLLVTCRLRHGTEIYEEQNPYILGAAPFCWIPGPHMWPVPDQRYSIVCTLTVEVFDLAKFGEIGGRGALGERHWYFSHTVTLDELYVSYIGRVGWNLHLYLPSIIVPTLILPFHRDGLADELEERAIEKLALTLTRDLQRRRVDLIRNDHDFGFFLDDDVTRVSWEGPEHVRVRFRLAHRVGSSRNEPERYTLAADDLAASAVPRRLGWQQRDRAHVPGSNASGHARYAFDELIAVTPDTRYLKLRVVAGRSPSSTREFSLALPPRPDPD